MSDDGFRITSEFAARVQVPAADLVADLRAMWKVECRRCHHFNSDMRHVHAIMWSAADEIEALRARVHALELESTGGWEIER